MRDDAPQGAAAMERTIRRNLARHVRQARAVQTLTIEAAAERSGLEPRQWQRVEAGEVNATIRTIARLCIALGTEASDLLEAAPIVGGRSSRPR
jgi:transcriptional regulator with XRE-family HTH domain